MNTDLELETWREAWRGEPPAPPDLRRRVERQSRWMRIVRAGSILITVIFGGWTTAWVAQTGRADVWGLAALTWASLAIAWTINLTNTRGLWSLASESQAEFLRLSIRRCEAQVRVTLFAAVLFCFNLAFTLFWVYRAQPLRPLAAFLISWRVCIVWAVTLAFFWWIVWRRRAKKGELMRLRELQKEMEPSMLP